ncbi:MAG TPA: YoaK family protein [Acidobacteriaceae bacterium]|nr:YoaK family protein [Acidobacteriaceae bacterium]
MSKQAGHPRLAIPEIPLIGLLCALAGSVDAAAYLLCGQIFVANMTGNTVLLAVSLLQTHPKEAALRAGMVAAFLAGVIVARLLTRTADKRLTKMQRVFILGIESLLLLLLAWKHAGAPMDLLLLLLACMLGIQNAAFQYIGGFHLNTTFITGDLEKLGEAMTGIRDALPKTTTFLVSWIAYASGACLGALNALNLPHHGFLVPTILAVASIITVSLMPDLAGRESGG